MKISIVDHYFSKCKEIKSPFCFWMWIQLIINPWQSCNFPADFSLNKPEPFLFYMFFLIFSQTLFRNIFFQMYMFAWFKQPLQTNIINKIMVVVQIKSNLYYGHSPAYGNCFLSYYLKGKLFGLLFLNFFLYGRMN